MLRRTALLTLPALLAACSGLDFSNAGITLDQVKEYTDDVVDALSAAANTYLVKSPNATVQAALQQLEQVRQAIDAATAPESARAAVDEALAFLNQLTPVLSPFLGAAAPYVPIAIAVLHNFVHNLGLPPNAPPTPPAALHRAAVAYRTKRH